MNKDDTSMLNQSKSNTISLLPWKQYLSITVESLLGFYLATFSLALYLIHQGFEWMFCACIMCALYLFVIIASAIRVARKLPLAAIMLIVPIAPLIALMIVVSLIPVLQNI